MLQDTIVVDRFARAADIEHLTPVQLMRREAEEKRYQKSIDGLGLKPKTRGENEVSSTYMGICTDQSAK